MLIAIKIYQVCLVRYVYFSAEIWLYCVYYSNYIITAFFYRSGATIEEDAVTTLANLCDGDARAALNNIEHILKSKISPDDELRRSVSAITITVDDVKDGMLRSHLQYDRTGNHLN